MFRVRGLSKKIYKSTRHSDLQKNSTLMRVKNQMVHDRVKKKSPLLRSQFSLLLLWLFFKVFEIPPFECTTYSLGQINSFIGKYSSDKIYVWMSLKESVNVGCWSSAMISPRFVSTGKLVTNHISWFHFGL